MSEIYSRPELSPGSEADRAPAPLVNIKNLIGRKKRGYRILFVGTSQTVGEGAARLNDTFFVRIHDSLVRSLGRPIESLNMAVLGSNSGVLFDDYIRGYIKFNPDLVIINLSSNDHPEMLRVSLTAFLAINNSKGIRTILLKEANSHERRKDGSLFLKHLIMEQTADKFDVPVLNLHAFLNRPEIFRTGYLWWDYVHLTSHGQAVAAQWLTPQIAAYLRRPPVVKAVKF